MARQHRCDVCCHPRRRWQRLCGFCFNALPYGMRNTIIDAHRSGKRPAHRAAVKAALDYLGDAVQRHMASHLPPAISPERSYQITAARMGEND